MYIMYNGFTKDLVNDHFSGFMIDPDWAAMIRVVSVYSKRYNDKT